MIATDVIRALAPLCEARNTVAERIVTAIAAAPDPDAAAATQLTDLAGVLQVALDLTATLSDPETEGTNP